MPFPVFWSRCEAMRHIESYASPASQCRSADWIVVECSQSPELRIGHNQRKDGSDLDAECKVPNTSVNPTLLVVLMRDSCSTRDETLGK